MYNSPNPINISTSERLPSPLYGTATEGEPGAAPPPAPRVSARPIVAEAGCLHFPGAAEAVPGLGYGVGVGSWAASGSSHRCRSATRCAGLGGAQGAAAWLEVGGAPHASPPLVPSAPCLTLTPADAAEVWGGFAALCPSASRARAAQGVAPRLQPCLSQQGWLGALWADLLGTGIAPSNGRGRFSWPGRVTRGETKGFPALVCWHSRLPESQGRRGGGEQVPCGNGER